MTLPKEFSEYQERFDELAVLVKLKGNGEVRHRKYCFGMTWRYKNDRPWQVAGHFKIDGRVRKYEGRFKTFESLEKKIITLVETR